MNAPLELPSPEQAKQAQEALRMLRSVKPNDSVRLVAGPKTHQVEMLVPRDAFDLFRQVLAEMANGRAVTLVPVHAELTTQRAADMLNVSRPYLIRLLEEGKLPFRMVGTHRRVLAKDVLHYQRSAYEESGQALEELAQIAQEEDFGY